MDANVMRMCTTAIRGIVVTEAPSESEFALLKRVLVPAGASVKVCAAEHLVVATPALRAFAPWAAVTGPATVADVLAAVRASLAASPPAALNVASPFGPGAPATWGDLLGARVRFEGFEEEAPAEQAEQAEAVAAAAEAPEAAAQAAPQAPAGAAQPPRHYTVALGV